MALLSACAQAVGPGEASLSRDASSADAPTPSGLDGTRRIRDLGAAEVDQLCQWLGDHGPVQTVPRPTGTLDDGTGVARGYRLLGVDPFCVVASSQQDCVANVHRRSCAATVAQLHACLSALASAATGGAPSQLDACQAYRQATDCSETVVVPASGGCPLPLR